MSLRNVSNWRVDDNYPDIKIDEIPDLSEKLNSLYARTLHEEHLKNSFMQLSGIIFMAKELGYHFVRFQKFTEIVGPPQIGQPSSFKRDKLIEEAKFEAIAYINTLGRINAWVRYQKGNTPKITNITKSFRDKHTAHRSIDAPRGESDDLQDLHALIFMGNLWSPSGELIFQIQKEAGQTVELNIIQEHAVICNEILNTFRNSLKANA